ncbi:MAG: GNAT family N-acetyltransferase [Burkholderiales bacterium RIFCSPHIGHO2_01_FULL_63_240]|nr:MAG: GNAT family N-acetyltransferase [Burkholderiales bacterium RIFCSPHIGHO2_01_FULL_63_240]
MNDPKESGRVWLQQADASSLGEFKSALQASFRVAAEADQGHPLDEPIPADEDIEQACQAKGAVTLWIMSGAQRAGGAVVTINPVTGRSALAFLFVATSHQSRGLGLQAWQAIEQAFPQTRVWATATPYFEKRNIHFYVNKCGFKIVAFYNRHHPDPNQVPGPAHEGGEEDEMFAFEKVMPPK